MQSTRPNCADYKDDYHVVPAQIYNLHTTVTEMTMNNRKKVENSIKGGDWSVLRAGESERTLQKEEMM